MATLTGQLAADPRRWFAAASMALLIAGCASTAATPTPAPTPTPTPTPIAGAWTAVASSPALDAVQLITVAWTGSRFVAGAARMDGTAAFLDSTDGLTWNLQTKTWPDAAVRKIAAGPSGLVAVGDQSGQMAAWTSSDGLSWTMAPDATSMHPAAGNSFHVAGVAPVSGGWMAVGQELPPCMGGCLPLRAVVWTSPDGKTWTRVPDAPAFDAGAMEAVIQWKGTYVAVGRTGKYATVWTSSNGTTWSKAPDSTAFHAPTGTDQEIGAGMAGIAAGSDRLVAVGQVYSQGDVGSALAWHSADTTTWTSATGDLFLHGQVFAVAAVPTGYLAVGPSGAPSCLGGIWSSADGATWKCVAGDAAFEGFYPYDAAASPAREIVVGFGHSGGATASAVWTRPLTAP